MNLSSPVTVYLREAVFRHTTQFDNKAAAEIIVERVWSFAPDADPGKAAQSAECVLRVSGEFDRRDKISALTADLPIAREELEKIPGEYLRLSHVVNAVAQDRQDRRGSAEVVRGITFGYTLSDKGLEDCRVTIERTDDRGEAVRGCLVSKDPSTLHHFVGKLREAAKYWQAAGS